MTLLQREVCSGWSGARYQAFSSKSWLVILACVERMSMHLETMKVIMPRGNTNDSDAARPAVECQSEIIIHVH